MRRRPRPSPDQGDLLSWASPVQAFDPRRVRGATLAASLAKGISAALKACGKSREQVAQDLGDYLGDPLEKSTLDKWASEASEGYLPTIVRFVGLIHATKSQELLQLIADQFGWAVVDKRYLPAIELAAMTIKKEELDRHVAALRRDLRNAGVLE